MDGPRVVLYDGYCNLCSRTVRWVKRNDRKGRFSFQPLQEHLIPDQLLQERPFADQPSSERPSSDQPSSERPTPEQALVVDTVVLLENGKRYEQSTAAIRIAIGLRFPWPLLGILFIVPPFIRNAVYDLVARNRKQWFGERSTCYLPED